MYMLQQEWINGFTGLYIKHTLAASTDRPRHLVWLDWNSSQERGDPDATPGCHFTKSLAFPMTIKPKEFLSLFTPPPPPMEGSKSHSSWHTQGRRSWRAGEAEWQSTTLHKICCCCYFSCWTDADTWLLQLLNWYILVSAAWLGENWKCRGCFRPCRMCCLCIDPTEQVLPTCQTRQLYTGDVKRHCLWYITLQVCQSTNITICRHIVG